MGTVVTDFLSCIRDYYFCLQNLKLPNFHRELRQSIFKTRFERDCYYRILTDITGFSTFRLKLLPGLLYLDLD